MYFSDGQEYPDQVPVWRFNPDGTIKNIRPTVYHREAERQMKQHGSKDVIGYRVKNKYGDIKPMTFKQAQRLQDLFARGFLTIIDFWKVHHVPIEYALTGYDTEGENAGIYNMPAWDD